MAISAWGSASSREARRDRRRQARGDRSACPSDGLRGGPFGEHRLTTGGVQFGGPLVEALQLVEPASGVVAIGLDLDEIVAVLAAQVAQQLATGTHLRQPRRVLIDVIDDPAQVPDDVVQLGEHATTPVR